jgi:F0F1-type ATP synthase delta subunit
MFHVSRWAGAFIAVSGKDAEEAFLCLKALAMPVISINGVFSGHSASAKLEKLLRESVSKEISFAMECAIRFLCLLVERNSFRYIDLLFIRIEKMLDKQKGILNFTLETAVPVESGFIDELTQMIKEKTGAVGVKLDTLVRQELLGGYLLRFDGFYIDASLNGQLEKMKTELFAAAGARGGSNG